MDKTTILILFHVFILGMLALDLGVFQRKAHTPSFREALAWSIVWVTLALIFNAGVWHWGGQKMALEFFTGYVIEKSLSVDNIFVFIMIFQYFSVKSDYHHEVLFYGIIGALITRAIFIVGGVALIERFHFIIYVMGGFLILTGIKFIRQKDEEIHPEKNPVLKLARRLFPVTPDYRGQKMFVRENGKIFMTPLFLVLILVESTDVVFAIDSIPAIFAITLDPFIVYTSNIFAILGLRALYFLLAGVIEKFRYLKIGLAFVLIFVGAKMLAVDSLAKIHLEIPIWLSLLAVMGLLGGSILLSLLKTENRQ